MEGVEVVKFMSKTFSIWAFVLSLLVFIPFATIAGLVMGIIALVKKYEGKGFAIAAVVIGALMMLPLIYMIIYFTGRMGMFT